MATDRERLNELRALKAQQKAPQSDRQRLETLRKKKADQQRMALEPSPVEEPIVEEEEPTLGEEIRGGLETVASLGSSIIAEPVAGLAGIATGLVTGDAEEGGRAVGKTREALTFEPRSQEGQENLESVRETLEPVADAFTKAENYLGDKVFDATGSPTLSAAAASIPTLATEFLGIGLAKGTVKGASKTKEAIKDVKITRELNEALPTIEQLKDTSRAVYNEIDDMGVTLKPDVYNRLVNQVRKKAVSQGLNKVISPKAFAAMREFEKLKGGNVKLSDLDTLRKISQNAANTLEGADKALGAAMVETVDNFLDSASPNQFLRADGDVREIGKRYRVARDLWGRARRAEVLEEAFDKARDQASGFENGLRVQFRSILSNKRKRKFFKPDEISAMQRVVRGDKKQNLAKLVGRLGFSDGQSTNLVGGTIGVAGGSVVGGTPGAVIVPLIGTVSRKLAERMTEKNAQFVDQVIRAGSDGRKIVEAYLDNTPKGQINSQELAELLLRPDISLDNLPKGTVIDEAKRFAQKNRETIAGGGVVIPITQNGDT